MDNFNPRKQLTHFSAYSVREAIEHCNAFFDKNTHIEVVEYLNLYTDNSGMVTLPVIVINHLKGENNES